MPWSLELFPFWKMMAVDSESPTTDAKMNQKRLSTTIRLVSEAASEVRNLAVLVHLPALLRSHRNLRLYRHYHLRLCYHYCRRRCDQMNLEMGG